MTSRSRPQAPRRPPKKAAEADKPAAPAKPKDADKLAAVSWMSVAEKRGQAAAASPEPEPDLPEPSTPEPPKPAPAKPEPTRPEPRAAAHTDSHPAADTRAEPGPARPRAPGPRTQPRAARPRAQSRAAGTRPVARAARPGSRPRAAGARPLARARPAARPLFPGPPVIPAVDAGLPAYTMPPWSGSAAAGGPINVGGAAQHDHQPRSGSTPYGVGASGGAGQPFGGSAAQVSSAPTRPTTYGSGSGQQPAAVPQQRMQGTVYGGLADYAPPDMTMPVSTNPVENSGSLTGHILAQGWRDGPDTQRQSNVKVIVAMLVVLLILVGVSLAFLFTVGDAFSDMIGGVFQGLGCRKPHLPLSWRGCAEG
nr:hypothetical protein GCM10020092_105890 [Actinoplanes digitatis]